MRKFFIAITLLTMLLASCGLTESEAAATSQALAEISLAETMAAEPTETSRPSQTSTLTASVTSTTRPTDPPSETPTQTPGPIIKRPTASMAPKLGGGRNAPLRFDNRTDEEILVIFPSHNYDQYLFTNSWNLRTPFGDYEYIIWIGNNGPFVGSFRINNIDKHILTFTEGKVKFHYP